jgi:camelysin-like metallo-endopeptidase
MHSTTATRSRRPSRRLAKAASLVAVPAAVAVSGLVVSQASYSAYSASTENPTSNWASGTVALSDDDNNTAAFNVANLRPGSTRTKCIAVTSTGTLPSSVKLYATNPATTKDLAAHMRLRITQGTGGSSGGCAGFTPLAADARLYDGTLEGFGHAANSYASGLGSWSPTGRADETRTFRVVYSVDADAPDSTQGGTAAGGLTWEAQNS